MCGCLLINQRPKFTSKVGNESSYAFPKYSWLIDMAVGNHYNSI